MTTTTLPITQAVAEWIKIFPKQVTENYTSSVTFMKQLTVIAVSKIVYMKNAFPKDSYTTETFGGLKLRILKKKCRNDSAQYLSTSLTQAFEAFDKKYLHKLALCFYEGECKLENLSEYHVFEYTYHTGEVTMNLHTKTGNRIEQTIKCTFENIKERTLEMIRAYTVINHSCQQELPSCYDFSIRLYYNKDAPENYQAPGYTRCEGEPEDHLTSSEHDSMRVGCVETPFHKLLAMSYFKNNNKASHEPTASENPPVMTQEVNATPATSRETRLEYVFRCPCNKYDVDEHSQLMGVLTCIYCKTLQHAACYGVLPELAPYVQRHCCLPCTDLGLGSSADGSQSPTDARLAALDLPKRESLCMFRRALVWCSARGSVGCAALRALGASVHNARRLLQQLHSYSVVADGDTEAPQQVNTEKLKEVMEKHFRGSGENNIADRLLAETFASQESRHDPVEAMLSPIEKVTLQNATYSGQMLEPQKSQCAAEDPTLQLYEEALLSSERDEEEMPLLEIIKKEKLRKGKRKDNEVKKSALKTGLKTKRARFTLK